MPRGIGEVLGCIASFRKDDRLASARWDLMPLFYSLLILVYCSIKQAHLISRRIDIFWSPHSIIFSVQNSFVFTIHFPFKSISQVSSTIGCKDFEVSTKIVEMRRASDWVAFFGTPCIMRIVKQKL